MTGERDRPAGGGGLFPRQSFYDRPNEAFAPSFGLGISFTTFSSSKLDLFLVLNGHAGEGNVLTFLSPAWPFFLSLNFFPYISQELRGHAGDGNV